MREYWKIFKEAFCIKKCINQLQDKRKTIEFTRIWGERLRQELIEHLRINLTVEDVSMQPLQQLMTSDLMKISWKNQCNSANSIPSEENYPSSSHLPRRSARDRTFYASRTKKIGGKGKKSFLNFQLYSCSWHYPQETLDWGVLGGYLSSKRDVKWSAMYSLFPTLVIMEKLLHEKGLGSLPHAYSTSLAKSFHPRKFGSFSRLQSIKLIRNAHP